MDVLKTLPRSDRNPVQDIWNKFKCGEISLEQEEMEIRRFCIDNLNKMYTPQVVATQGMETEKEKWLLRSLISHNMCMANWLHDCKKYAGLEMGQLLAKIDSYKQTVYRQKERLKSLSVKS